ncbi:MAG: DUF308 domain-containing protein [Sphingomicrobium sp.]
MASHADHSMSPGKRATLIYAAGIAIILLSAGALLLPAADRLAGSAVIGGLLLAAGIFEMFAGSMRGEVKHYAMAAGGVTALAGLLFLIYPSVHFAPTVTLIIAWLVLRSVILIIASRRSDASVRLWMTISAGMDFVLAVLLLFGLSISALVMNIFGPTEHIVAAFSWVLAASFVVTGSLLLEVASCQRNLA